MLKFVYILKSNVVKRGIAIVKSATDTSSCDRFCNRKKQIPTNNYYHEHDINYYHEHDVNYYHEYDTNYYHEHDTNYYHEHDTNSNDTFEKYAV